MDDAKHMKIDEIHGFASPKEYERFMTWIAGQVESGALTEVEVESRYADSPMFE